MFCSRFIRFLLLVIVLFVGDSVFADTRIDVERQLRRHLVDRAEKYLETVCRSSGFDVGLRQRESVRARSVVEQGFSRLRGDDSAAANLFPTNTPSVLAALRRLDKSSDDPAILRAAEFLERRFHAPTQREIAVFLAIPDRDEQARILGLSNGTPQPTDDSEPSEIRTPSVAETVNAKNLRDLLVFVRDLPSTDALPLFFLPLDLVRDRIEGFPSIAQTTIRRE